MQCISDTEALHVHLACREKMHGSHNIRVLREIISYQDQDITNFCS
jgi:hypothetical protein